MATLKSFWAVELVPGKEFTTTPEFDVHVTAAILPAGVKDKERTLVTATYAEVDEEDNEKPGQAFTIASLKLDHNDSQNIDLIFDADVPVTFAVVGKNPVHLVGSLVPPQGDDDDFMSDDDEDILSQEEDEEGEDAEDDEDEEAAAAIQAQLSKKRPAGQQTNGAAAKKPKQEQAAPKQEQKKPQQQQQTPKQGGEQKKPQQQQQKTPQQQKERTLQGGLKVITVAEGEGKVAKKGNRVAVKYVGKLANGKVFDKSTGAPFSFGLGRGEVIKGWDLGVEGMKEGEKRRLVIPPGLAYGAGGAPPQIPPHSTLTFDVELVRA